jgi:polysaccharide pyruvyl transferase WcaK-like protein
MHDRRRRVALLGVNHQVYNYGVRVLLSSAVEALSAAEPDAELLLLDYAGEPEQWAEKAGNAECKMRLVNLRFSWRLYLPNNVFLLVVLALLSHAVPIKNWRVRFLSWNPWLREILQTAVNYSIAGGDSFSDIYGMMRFLYVALPQILVLLLGRDLVLLPQTYGPYNGWVARFLARWIMRRARTIVSRDTQGVETVRQVAGADGPNVQVVPDLGFCMTAEAVEARISQRIEELRSGGPIVGINVSSLLYMGGYTGDNMFKLRDPFPALVAALVDHTVRDLGAGVLLVPHVCGGPLSQEDETRLCDRLQAEFSRRHGERVRYLGDHLSHRQTKAVIGQCDLFIGARMHACIAALSQGIPAVGLAYSRKFRGVFASIGMEELVADLRVWETGRVIEILDKAYERRGDLQSILGRKMPAVRAQVLDLFKRLPA